MLEIEIDCLDRLPGIQNVTEMLHFDLIMQAMASFVSVNQSHMDRGSNFMLGIAWQVFSQIPPPVTSVSTSS